MIFDRNRVGWFYKVSRLLNLRIEVAFQIVFNTSDAICRFDDSGRPEVPQKKLG